MVGVVTESIEATAASHHTRFSLGYATIDHLTKAMTINLVSKHSYLKNGYKPMDFVNDLVGYLFSETAHAGNVNLWTREMQRRAVENLIKSWRVTLVAEQRPYVLAALKKIQARISTASGDADTRAHYADLALQIRLALDGKLPEQKSSTATAGGSM